MFSSSTFNLSSRARALVKNSKALQIPTIAIIETITLVDCRHGTIAHPKSMLSLIIKYNGSNFRYKATGMRSSERNFNDMLANRRRNPEKSNWGIDIFEIN